MIRDIRGRLGLTQRQLADLLHVDQGTVSRWERGLDEPRPARRAALHNMLLKDESRRALRRSIAFVRQDFLPSSLLDHRLRMVELSASGRRHYETRGEDPDKILGQDIERHADRAGEPELHQFVRASGLIEGKCLLFRFARNVLGKGHMTVYEPIFEDGKLVGVLNFVTHRFPLSDTSVQETILVEAVQNDDLDKPRLIHRGPGADEVLRALGRDDVR